MDANAERFLQYVESQMDVYRRSLQNAQERLESFLNGNCSAENLSSLNVDMVIGCLSVWESISKSFPQWVSECEGKDQDVLSVVKIVAIRNIVVPHRMLYGTEIWFNETWKEVLSLLTFVGHFNAENS